MTRSPRNTLNTFQEGNNSSIFDMPPSNGTMSSYNIPYQRPFSTKIMGERNKPSGDPLGVYLRQPIASGRPVMTPDGSLRQHLLNNNKPSLPSRKNLTSCKPRQQFEQLNLRAYGSDTKIMEHAKAISSKRSKNTETKKNNLMNSRLFQRNTSKHTCGS